MDRGIVSQRYREKMLRPEHLFRQSVIRDKQQAGKAEKYASRVPRRAGAVRNSPANCAPETITPNVEERMFQRRSNEFNPRFSSIAGHLRAIEQEIGGIGKSAGRHAAAGAASAGNQIADALEPILNDIVDWVRRGQATALDEGENFGNEAIKIGVSAGNKTVGPVATLAEQRPLITLAVAIGLGISELPAAEIFTLPKVVDRLKNQNHVGPNCSDVE